MFEPTGRLTVDAHPKAAVKWLGGFHSNYAFLGDYGARMLGVGKPIVGRRVPAWLNNFPLALRQSKGGASRVDREFRGWG